MAQKPQQRQRRQRKKSSSVQQYDERQLIKRIVASIAREFGLRVSCVKVRSSDDRKNTGIAAEIWVARKENRNSMPPEVSLEVHGVEVKWSLLLYASDTWSTGNAFDVVMIVDAIRKTFRSAADVTEGVTARFKK